MQNPMSWQADSPNSQWIVIAVGQPFIDQGVVPHLYGIAHILDNETR